MQRWDNSLQKLVPEVRLVFTQLIIPLQTASSQQKQSRLFPCACIASVQEARPAAAALRARFPVSPRGGGATTHLPQMSSHRSILDTARWLTDTEGRRGEERRGHGDAESVLWRIMSCARRPELTRCLNNYISHYVKMKESVLPFVCLLEENIFFK